MKIFIIEDEPAICSFLKNMAINAVAVTTSAISQKLRSYLMPT